MKEDTPGSLRDVESILDEIESLVAGGGTEGTAKPTSVVESVDPEERTSDTGRVDLEADLGTQNMEQLSVDLDAAIADELDQLERKMDSDSIQEEIEHEEETPDADSMTVDTPHVEDEATVERTVGDEDQTKPTSRPPGIGDRLLMIMSGPIPSMSRGSRIVVSTFALSLAIWVPLIWMLALTTTPAGNQESPPTGSDSVSSSDVDEIEQPTMDG